MKKLLCCCLILVLCLAFSSVYASTTFYDTRGTKYEGVVERMARLEIINGMSETTFAPNRNVTRAELAKIITKMRGMDGYAESGIEYKKIFSDVKETDWFYPYVTVAADLELVNGYEDGTFKPNQEVSYAELVVILLRNLGYNNISEDSPNGWYWNYIRKMRELELNDNVGEFDYTKPAKRGDVAMFAWNALITDRWAISSENSKDGFTYTYASETPLEIFFEDYSFLDNETIDYIGGADDEISIGVGYKLFYTKEKTPLYALGGKITSLYNEETGELIGVTIDEDYENVEIVSGPEFYLKEEGYKISSANKTVTYGSRENANYIYLVIDKETKDIKRAVYVDSSKSIVVNSISVDVTEESGDTEKEITIKINDEEYSSKDTVLYKDGFKADWKGLKDGDVVTDLGNGLFVYSNQKITKILTDFDSKDDMVIIGEDKYYVLDNCECYFYNEDEAVQYDMVSTSKIKKQIGIVATFTLNIAEEVCSIEFGQSQEDKERYQFGFVTDVRFGSDSEYQRIKVNYGDTTSRYIEITSSSNNWVSVGDLVAIGEKNDTDEFRVVEKDTSFDNNISVKYQYDAKKIEYPMIGEYIVNSDTEYFKVTLKYKNNSIYNVEECQISRLDFEKDIEDLSAYTIHLIYNEDMEVIKVFAVNEINKFDNQIALVKDTKVTKDEDKNETYKLTLSVVNDAVRGYQIETNFDNISSGDIITFIREEDDEVIVVDEIFKKESIGYKRDLIVKSFDADNKEVVFEYGDKMNLDEDVYNWNGKKINLNNYRFIIAEVSDRDGDWKFNSLKMYDKENVKVEQNDRFAIGELQDVIVIYRGYEE